jgi:hypothetical protein
LGTIELACKGGLTGAQARTITPRSGCCSPVVLAG